MSGKHETGSAVNDDQLLDKASIIHLLRVFIGAVEGEERDSRSPPPSCQHSTTDHNKTSGRDGDQSPPSRKHPRLSSAFQPGATEEDEDDGSLVGNAPSVVHTVTNRGQHDDLPPSPTPLKAAGNSSVSARIDAGCMLWDMSVEETCAVVMQEAGLIPVVVAVLQHCWSCSRAEGAVAADADAAEAVKSDAIIGEPDGVDVERLREVTCGLLANVCSHRSLRQHFFGDSALSEELTRAFHSTDDPACLTELLRLFSIAAMAISVPASGTQDVDIGPRIRGLGEGLVTEETLKRVGFFLANSLEEKLLSHACSFTYSLMYRFGDDVILPLVEKCRLEESLASLLVTRGTDLSYEQLGGAETGLDYLLRCLEVLSTSEMSCIGPCSQSVQQPLPPPGSPAKEFGSAVSVPCAKQMGPSKVRNEDGPTAGVPGGKSESVESGDTVGQTGPESDLAGGDAKGRKFVVDHVVGDGNGEVQEGVRGSVIRGLVRILEPWEHTRRTQKAALLVLGNVLENVLEVAAGGSGAEQVSALVRETVWGLEEEVEAGDSGGNLKEGGGAADERGDDCHDRRRQRTTDFVENITHLLRAEEPSSGETGIDEELAEASAVVRKMLEISSRDG